MTSSKILERVGRLLIRRQEQVQDEPVVIKAVDLEPPPPVELPYWGSLPEACPKCGRYEQPLWDRSFFPHGVRPVAGLRSWAAVFHLGHPESVGHTCVGCGHQELTRPKDA